MATKDGKWYPLLKINDRLVVMAKCEFKNTVYALLYKHTFSFVTPRNLLDAEIFHIKPKDLHTTAEKLRYYRHKKALLQKDVAKRVGISSSTYMSYETASRHYYPIDVLRKIAHLYDIDVTELLDDYNLFLYYGQGLQLKKLIKALNLTKKSVGEKLNVHEKTITAWENERIKMSKNMYVKIFKDNVLSQS